MTQRLTLSVLAGVLALAFGLSTASADHHMAKEGTMMKDDMKKEAMMEKDSMKKDGMAMKDDMKSDAMEKKEMMKDDMKKPMEDKMMK